MLYTDTVKANAIEAIEEYMCDNLFEPNRHWPKDEFDRKSCERWAAKEIIHRIKLSNKAPTAVVYIFMKEMEKYSLMDIDHYNAYMCRLASEIAEEIGSLLC